LGFNQTAQDIMDRVTPRTTTTPLIYNGAHYAVKTDPNGNIVSARDEQGHDVDNKTIAGLQANALGMAGATTGQTMGYDKNGDVISHTILKNGEVVWKNQRTGQTLSGAPEGYHTGQDPLEMRIMQGKKQILTQHAAANAKQQQATGQNAFSPEQTQQALADYEGSMRGTNVAAALPPGLSTTVNNTGSTNTNQPAAPAATPGDVKRQALDQTAIEVFEGRQAMPTGMGANNLENKYIRQRVQEIAAERNQPFDANKFALNQKVITKDYSPAGPQGKNIIALNTAIKHMAVMEDKARGLNNSDTHAVNQWSQSIGKYFNQPNVTSFEALRPIVAGEIGKTITSGGGTDRERQEAENAIKASNTPAEMTANLRALKEAMAGKLDALRLPYQAAGGQDFDKKFLLPETQVEMAKLKTGGHVPTKEEIAAERARRKGQQ